MERNDNIKRQVLPFLLEKDKKKEEPKQVNQPEQPTQQPITVDTTIVKTTENTTKEKTVEPGKATVVETTTEVVQNVEPVITDFVPVQDMTIPLVEEKPIVTPIPLSEDKVQVNTTEETVKTKEETELKPLTDIELTHIAIVEEIKEYIDDDLKEVNELAYKIKVLKDQEDEEVYLAEVEKIRKQLDELIKRIEELRDKYQKIYAKLDLENIKVVDNDVLEISIKDFIEDTKEGQDTSRYFDQIEEVTFYIDILQKLIAVDLEKDELSLKVDQKIELFEERDQDFEQAQDEYADIDKINYDIEKYNSVISQTIEELDEKLSRSADITRRTESSTNRMIDFGRILAASILLAQSRSIPPTPRGMFLRAGLLGGAITLLLNSTYEERHTRRITEVHYTDYRKEILNGKEIITETLKLIGTSLDELEEIKKNFEEEFQEYASSIPEYATLIKNIIDLEKELQRQEEKAYKYSKELDEQLKVNDEKVKKIEEIE